MRTTIICIIGFLMTATSFAQASLLDGLVTAYSFSGNAIDETGNGNDGTVTGASLTTDRNGVSEAAYSFDGVDDFIDIGNGVKPPFPFTVNLWFKPDVLRTQPLIRNDTVDGNSFRHGVLLNALADGRVAVTILNGFATSGTRRSAITTDSLAVIDEWHMMTAVLESVDDMRLYWDGVEQNVMRGNGSGTGMTFSNAAGGIGNLDGASGAGNFRFFGGAVDDVRVYNRTLSDQEIFSLVSAPSQLPEPTTCLLLGAGVLGIISRRRLKH